MIIIRESGNLSVADWLDKVQGVTFNRLYFQSNAGLGTSEYGKFRVIPNHKNFDNGNITICPPEGPVITKMSIVIDHPQQIAKITSESKGYRLCFRSGDLVSVYM